MGGVCQGPDKGDSHPMTCRPGLTVLMPVFNEESLLVPNTGRLLELLGSLKIPYEIIIGSNGSTDMTKELAGRLCNEHQNIRFFHLPR